MSRVHARRLSVPDPTPDWRSASFDALIAFGCAFISMTMLAQLLGALPSWERVLVVALVLVHTLSVFWRRRNPWLVLAINLASGLAVLLLGLPMVVLGLAALLAMYALAAQVPRDRSIWGLAAAIAGLLVGEVVTGLPQDLSTIVGNVLILSCAWLIGSFVYVRQLSLVQLELRTKELEAARDELARVIVTEERLRIARELHDVVAHSLSLIAVQSGVGAHVMEEQPEEGRRALRAVEEVSRQALTEMRRLLGVLREDAEPDLSPVRGLSGVDEIIKQISVAGPCVELQVLGNRRPLTPAVESTAYRIIQESLTNVVKHSRASKARTVLDYGPDRLVIEVVDDGHGPSQDNGDSGYGLAGMQERAALFGGSLDAGPLRDGGFRVRAELPLSDAYS